MIDDAGNARSGDWTMTSRFRWHTVTTMIGLVGLLPAARGQYAPGMNGRANDASNQVGSGGINQPVQPGYFNHSNLYVTGNVTRGAHFRGNSPISDPSSLFAPLGSLNLSNFQRDSISVNTVLNNPTPWQSTPFFDPVRTTGGVNTLQSGLNQPGSSIPRTSYTLPRGLSYRQPGAGPIDPMTGRPRGNSVLPNSSIYTPENTPSLAGTETYDRLRMTEQIRALNNSPIFRSAITETLPLAPSVVADRSAGEDPYGLDLTTTRQLRIDPIARGTRTVGGFDADPDRDALLRGSPELLSPRALAPRLFADREDTGALGTDAPQADDVARTGPRLLTVPTQPIWGETVALTPTIQPVPASEGGDRRLFDLAEAYSVLREGAAGGATEATAEDPSGQSTEPGPRYTRAMNIVRESAAVPVKSLAGDSQSRIDALLRDAEAKVRAGEYYQASTLYDLAVTLDPDNPLVHLGYAHALAAAGEYITAVFELSAAIEAYPAFAFLELNLNDFVRDPRDLDRRRADLERRLDREEDYRLRFLLGYIEYYTGLRKFGLPNLRKAASTAPADSMVARFPEILDSRATFLPTLPVSEVRDTGSNADTD
jgi:hypothetical protein